MKFTFRHEIEAPMEDLIELTQDRVGRDVKVYPNVTSVKMLEEKQEGNKKFTKLETCANGDIPPKLRKLIQPKMLSWIEEGVFDYDKNEYSYNIKPFYFKDRFIMKAVVKWKKLSDNKTLREMKGEIKVKVPVLGQIAEKKISETQKENLDLDVKKMVEEAEELRKARG